MDEIEMQVKTILAAKLGVDITALKGDAAFTYDFGADSLDILESIMDIEKQLHIKIPDEEVEKLKTVNQLLDYVKQQKING